MKNKYIKKKILKISFLFIKPFIIPIILALIVIFLIASITDILYIAFDNDVEIDMEKELAYYGTDYQANRDKEDVENFFSSVWDFTGNILGGMIFSYETDWPVERIL